MAVREPEGHVNKQDILDRMLTTENGMGASNRIFLEPEVFAALTAYVDSLRKEQIELESEGE